MLEQGTLAGVRIEAKPEPATQISAVRGPRTTRAGLDSGSRATLRNEYVDD